MKRVWLCWMVCLVAAVGFLPTASRAQVVITETQPLRFGTVVVPNFGSVARITVNAGSGATSYNANVIPITAGQRAEYHLTGGPPNTNFTVTIDSDTDPVLGANPAWTLDNFTIRPNTLRTNAAGEDDFFIGARLRTVGGGTPYGDGTYLGDYDFTVNF